jgi:hypothetical protein
MSFSENLWKNAQKPLAKHKKQVYINEHYQK